jgi:hypothetical protein
MNERRRHRLRFDDLAWGILMGAIGIGIVVMAVLIIRGPGGGHSANACNQPLAPLGQSPITAEEFQAVDKGLQDTIAAAQLGSLAGAENSFFGRVHNFTHNVDPPLRQKDPDLARTLCRSVLNLENEFSLQRQPQEIARLAQDLQGILRDAAVELGYPRPGGQ